jgi:hypothetical protein
VARVRDVLAAQGKPHFQEFLAAWGPLPDVIAQGSGT